jgi:hypothetical protein
MTGTGKPFNHIKVSRNKTTWGEQLAATPDAIIRTRQAAKLAISGNSDTYSCFIHGSSVGEK